MASSTEIIEQTLGQVVENMQKDSRHMPLVHAEEIRGVMNQYAREVGIFHNIVDIKTLLTRKEVIRRGKHYVISEYAAILGWDRLQQLLDQGLLSSVNVLGNLMDTLANWRHKVKTLDDDDVVVIVIAKKKYLVVCERVIEFKRQYLRRYGPPADGSYLKRFFDIWAVMKHGRTAHPITTALNGTREIGIRVFAKELKGDIPHILLDILRASESLLCVNVGGLAIAIMSSVVEMKNNVLVLSTQWNSSEDRPGTWERAPIWTHHTGNSDFKEWIVIGFRPTTGEILWVCIVIIFRVVLYGWMSFNLKTRNTNSHLIPDDCRIDVVRNGHLVARVQHAHFRQALIKVMNKITLWQSGRDFLIVGSFFRALYSVITHCDNNCMFYYFRLWRMQYLLRFHRCGVYVLLWYLRLHNGGVELTTCDRDAIVRLIQAVRLDNAKGVSDIVDKLTHLMSDPEIGEFALRSVLKVFNYPAVED